MKRANLIDRVSLLAERRHALVYAAKEASRADLTGEWHDRALTALETQAIKYAVVAIRYLGGDKP